jgi:hypothetical protein
MKNFKLITCPCGCGGKFHESQSDPIGFKTTDYYGGDGPKRILEVERGDGTKFRVGDTVERTTERGESFGLGIIYEIEDLTEKHPNIGMRLFVRTLYTAGTAVICNTDHTNADYPNMFRFLKNVTTRK